MQFQQQVSERIADVAAGVSAGGALAGTFIEHANEWLQAGAFIIAMISGAAAALYHITRWWVERKKRKSKA